VNPYKTRRCDDSNEEEDKFINGEAKVQSKDKEI
jgi:hypothetical protein